MRSESWKYIIILFATIVIMSCHSDGCNDPAPLEGEFEPFAPGYIVTISEGFSVEEEVARFQITYEFQDLRVFVSFNQFFAEMSDSDREKLRCEESVEIIHFNGIITGASPRV